MSTLQDIRDYFASDFSQCPHHIDAVGPGTATVRERVTEDHLRPGGTVSGTVMMSIADCAMYAAIFGAVAKNAVTGVGEPS